MSSELFPRAMSPALAVAVALLVTWALAGRSGAAVPGCPSFDSQAAAQEYFVALGGGPRRPVGGLDGDRDGVACEERPAPYEGFATIGYNRKRRFFYGTVAMPPAAALAAAGERSACLYGNRHFPEGPRRLRVYRAQPGADPAVTDSVGAAAIPSDSRLVWKAEKRTVPAARYYVQLEERVPISPYGPNECPGFRSAEVTLPTPAGSSPQVAS